MAKLTDETRASLRRRSRLVNLGRDVEFSQGFVNVPPFRGSTVLYPDVATLKSRAQRFTYGTRGTPTTEALSSAWTDLAGAAGTVLVAIGPGGDHRRADDGAQGRRPPLDDATRSTNPSRAFADKTLQRFGIETELLRPDASAPGSTR